MKEKELFSEPTKVDVERGENRKNITEERYSDSLKPNSVSQKCLLSPSFKIQRLSVRHYCNYPCCSALGQFKERLRHKWLDRTALALREAIHLL